MAYKPLVEGTIKRAPQRSCVGCDKLDWVGNLVRFVVAPSGEVVPDLADRAFGRGTYLHASPLCLRVGATRGISRSLGVPIRVDARVLAEQVVENANRRVLGLLHSAMHSGGTVVGIPSVTTALESGGLGLVLVARDAGSSVWSRPIKAAVAEGQAVSWGTKSLLGSLWGRDEVAVLGIRSARIGAAIAATCRAADGAQSGSEVR